MSCTPILPCGVVMNSHLFLRQPVQYSISIILILLVISLSGCSDATAEPSREVSITNIQIATVTPTQPYSFRKSDPGYITIRGSLIVLDPMSIVPSPDDGIFLVPMPIDQPISSVPQFEVGQVPQADVDEVSGEFTFTNIEPGQYAVVVITAGGSQFPVRYSENGNYAIFTVDASQKDTTVDIGHLTLP